MRIIFKKIQRHQELAEEEYRQLMEYIDKLRSDSPESYLLFHHQYANILYANYATYLPRFARGRDDFINYLLSRPELIQELKQHRLPVNSFPMLFHPYLLDTFGDEIDARRFPLLELLKQDNNLADELPAPRTGEVVYKYEDSNPYKEQGLKTHFERISRYSFVTRLQSYRYLTRNKSRRDKIEVVSDDHLGGIFTNKQKSIYYYIFLTENNEIKARNASRILNLALYDS